MRRTAPFSGTLLFVVTALLHSRCYGQRTQSQQQRQHPPTADSRRDGRRRLIVNGHDARRGRYPYFVGIEDYCGGTLIAPDMVLTAGHCAPKRRRDDRQIHPRVSAYYNLLEEGENDEDNNSNKKNKNKKRRRRDADEEGSDDYDYDDDGDDQGQGEADNDTGYEEVFFDVDTIWVHPNFTRLGDDEFAHDYSVWKLRGAGNRSWDFALPRINRQSQVPHNQQRMTVIGLGVLDAEEMVERPHALQQVTIDAIANDVCENTTNPETGETLIGRIHETHLCTYTYFNHNAQDACAYDSGGPILIAPDEGDGDDRGDSADAAPDLLVGMVSWGIGCADPVFPAVNSRVSAASDWIDEVVCQHSDAPPSSLHEFCRRGRERPPHAIAPTKAAAVRSTLVAVAIQVGVALLLFVCAWLIYDRRLKRAASLRDGGDVEDGEGGHDEEYDDMPLITMVSDDADSPNLLGWSPRKPWKTFSSGGRDLRRDSTMTAATADSDEDDAAASYPRSTESTPLCTPVVGGATGRGGTFAAAGRPPSSFSSGGRKTYRTSP